MREETHWRAGRVKDPALALLALDAYSPPRWSFWVNMCRSQWRGWDGRYSVEMKLKAGGLDELSWGENSCREEAQGWDPMRKGEGPVSWNVVSWRPRRDGVSRRREWTLCSASMRGHVRWGPTSDHDLDKGKCYVQHPPLSLTHSPCSPHPSSSHALFIGKIKKAKEVVDFWE